MATDGLGLIDLPTQLAGDVFHWAKARLASAANGAADRYKS